MTAQEKRDTTALRKLNEINDELSTKLKQAMDDFIRDNPPVLCLCMLFQKYPVQQVNIWRWQKNGSDT